MSGGPYPVFVSIHPILLGEPICTIGIYNSPVLDKAITVTAIGNIEIVTRQYIRTFCKAGARLLFNISKYGITHAGGVTMDTDGYMYIIGRGMEHKLIKMSMSSIYSVIAHVTVQSGTANCLAVVGDEVMVRGTDRIKVYAKDLLYTREFDAQICVFPGCIHVLTKSGEFLWALSTDGIVGAFDGLDSMCVAGDYIMWPVQVWDAFMLSIMLVDVEGMIILVHLCQKFLREKRRPIKQYAPTGMVFCMSSLTVNMH